MDSFKDIYARAVKRRGGAAEVDKQLPEVKTPEELAAAPDDRYLAAMAKQIFRAGFAWKVIEAKWPGFEEAFHGFDPHRVAALNDDELDALAKDTRIVRNYPKIKATHENAHFVRDVAERHGGFGKFLAGWPDDDTVGLWDALKKGGSRLGGNTGPMFLRMVGKDTFVFSKDVVAVLVANGIADKAPSSKRDLAAAQAAFNAWREESGRPLSHLSRILAMSVG